MTTHYITGLTPNATYTATVANGQMTVAPGGSLYADRGGVLKFPGGAAPPPPPPPPPDSSCGTPGFCATLSAAAVAVGGSSTLGVTMFPGSLRSAVDAYVVLQTPAGQYYSLQLNGTWAPGIQPVARRFVPFVHDGPVLTVGIPAGTPAGGYSLLSALTQTGTLKLVTPISTVTFTVTP